MESTRKTGERFALAWAAWAEKNRSPAPEPSAPKIAPPDESWEATEARWRAAYLETVHWFLRMGQYAPPSRPPSGDPGEDRGYYPSFASEVRLSEVGRPERREIPY